MMHEDADDDEEEVILDRRTLIHQPKHSNPSSDSGPILLGVNRFDIKVYDDPVKATRAKVILLAATCIAIGMFTGLLGPTFPFLAQRMPADLSGIIWLIAIKAIGFLIGTILSAYLYAWFNVCCLLGLSCLAISFGVCSLPLITDLATFYLTSLILGIGLAISYNGIDALYNRLWARPSLASVRWLHLLVALGAILSTLMLLPSTLSNRDDHSLTTLIPQLSRPRRQALEDIASRLAFMPSNDTEQILFNNTYPMNESLLTTIATTSTTSKVILKPSIVETDDLKQSNVAKPTSEADQVKQPIPCKNFYCCYHRNGTNTNETMKTNPFTCQENDNPLSNDCKDILTTCQPSNSSICLLNKTYILCQRSRVCGEEKQPQCSIQSINTALNASTSTVSITLATKTPTTNATTTIVARSSTTTSTTTARPTTTTSTTTARPTITTSIKTTVVTTTSTTTTTTTTTTRRKKPSMAESDIDDLSENLFYKKIHTFFQSITSIHLIYLFLASSFFLLGIFYSALAMRGEGANSPSSSKPTTVSSLSLLFGKSHRTRTNTHTQLSLLADRASLQFVLLLILFYFILAGIESSCVYLTYLFGIQLKFEKYQSLLIEFLFFLGLLSGRLIDILMDYGCFLFNTRITNRTKKQSDKFHLISVKLCIIIRLILLLLLCSTLSFSHLFEQSSPTKSSIPSIHMFYLIFFLIGLLLASLPTLVLFWIERDLSLNDSLIRMILITITSSEIIFPSFLFYTIRHVVLSYLFYLFLGSCLLLLLFIFIVYASRKWQRKRLYRILPTSMELDEINTENHSDEGNDDDGEEYHLRNGRTNLNELDNERTKGLKGH